MVVRIRPKLLLIPALILSLLLSALLGGSALRAGTAPREETRLPILMYHSVCVNPRANSEYVLPPERFRADMEYLKAHGYTTVFFSEVLAYARGAGELPEKPVAITLDDGFLNALTEVLPVLETLDMKAEINLVGDYCLQEENAEYRSPAYSYLNKEEIGELRASGRFEFGSHTFAMHGLADRRGCAQKPGESDADYAAALNGDLRRMEAELLAPCGIKTGIFAYPFGAYGENTKKLLVEAGFEILLTCEERVNLIYPGAELTGLGRFHRAASLTTEEFMEKTGL